MAFTESTSVASIALSTLAWLATYAVHSTVLLGAAWWVTRRMNAERTKQLIWRVALLGGIVTASIQTLGALGPARGADFDLTAWASGEVAAAEWSAPLPLPGVPLIGVPFAGVEERPEPGLAGALGADGGWALVALLGWFAGGVALVGLFRLARRHLDRELVGAYALDTGPLPEMVTELRARAGLRRNVRLFVAPLLKGPIATGVLQPRIWLPPRALTELDPQLQESMLGHELAHVARLDPLWLGLCRGLETLFFFQPLNRVARRKLSECAEYLCDEDAVRYTGDRLSLARCLAEVATWFVGRAAPLPACGMADRRSPLGLRVERILDGERRDRRPAWVLPLLAVTLGSTVLYAPGFSAEAGAPADPTEAITAEPLPAERDRVQRERATSRSRATASETAGTPLALIVHELDELESLRSELARDVADLRARSAGRRMTEDQRDRLQSVQARADNVNARLDLVRHYVERVQRIQESKAAR